MTAMVRRMRRNARLGFASATTGSRSTIGLHSSGRCGRCRRWRRQLRRATSSRRGRTDDVFVRALTFPPRIHFATCGGSSLSWKIERLLKTHGIDFRLSARNKRLAFDLIEPIVVMKHCDVRVTTARSRDAELTTVEPADSMRDVELDQASFRHL